MTPKICMCCAHSTPYFNLTIFWTPHTRLWGWGGSHPVGFRGKALVGGLRDEPPEAVLFLY